MERRVLQYGNDPSHVGELFVPDADDGAPAVMCVFHGGGWRTQSDRHLADAVCADLAEHGVAAWNVEYRRVGRDSGGGWPHTFQDAASAVDRLADFAGEHDVQLDLDRVGSVGQSAGGHLALWLAARSGVAAMLQRALRVRVARAIGQAPVPDLVEAARLDLGDGAAQRLMGGPPESMVGQYAVGSPQAHVPLGIPQLLVHGTDDDRVPIALSRTYAHAARKAGDDVELVELDGIGHFEHLDPESEAWGVVLAWLRDAGWLAA